jgi:hypothetical protein
MDATERQLAYDNFLERLEYFKKIGFIKILKRGVTKKFAFQRVNLDLKYNSMDQFAEKIFYYGEKSKYFWEQKNGRKFSINDFGNDVFQYIFEKLNEISEKEDSNIGTTKYKLRNKKTFKYFCDLKNLALFTQTANHLEKEERKQFRNYYFRIIHQLGETDYKKNSLNVSGTENEEIANQFSNSEITINFWDFNFNQFQPSNKEMPLFTGKPYKNQHEISVFGVIFPHYIHSFKYNKQYFYNPALFNGTDFDSMIFGGFDIDQTELESKFKTETSYEIGLNDNGGELTEIV